MLNEEDIEILDDFCITRNLQDGTRRAYKNAITRYVESQGMHLKELLQEAEEEEEQGIRLKNRKLKKRMITHRNYLINEKNYSEVTLKKALTFIRTIYHHYEIEIPRIPKLNDRNVKKYEEIYYDDLPSKELIAEAISISKPLMKSIILFICSSGCARKEVMSLTIQDFINATSDYHNATDITDCLDELKGQDNIVPTFKLKRNKVNKYYYTFCSPEATTAIMNYLNSRNDKLEPESKLFDIHQNYLSVRFARLNRKLGGYKKGAFNIMRMHMLRKFHASNLARGENGLTLEEIDSLQGRGKEGVHQSYFYDDPRELRKKYIKNMDKVMINVDVQTLTIDSQEVLELKKKAAMLERENEEMKENINRAVDDRISEVLRKYGF